MLKIIHMTLEMNIEAAGAREILTLIVEGLSRSEVESLKSEIRRFLEEKLNGGVTDGRFRNAKVPTE